MVGKAIESAVTVPAKPARTLATMQEQERIAAKRYDETPISAKSRLLTAGPLKEPKPADLAAFEKSWTDLLRQALVTG